MISWNLKSATKSWFPTMADLNMSSCLMGKGTPCQICKAEPPEITLPRSSQQRKVGRPEEWAVALVSTTATLCTDILAHQLSEEEQKHLYVFM